MRARDTRDRRLLGRMAPALAAVAAVSWLGSPCFASSSVQQRRDVTRVSESPWLWGSLRPGPHAVGVTVIAGVDTARSEQSGGAEAHRPIDILLWYPATRAAGARPVTFALYADLSEGRLRDRRANPSTREWRRRWLASSIARDPAAVSDTLADRILSTPMAAVLDAPSLPQPVPLVLWSIRYATPAGQSVLSEYLASHGYAVAWPRYAGIDSLPPPFDDVTPERKLAVLEAHVAHMRWAVRRLAAHPSVDSTSVALAAWSYSGEPATMLALRAPEIDLLLSLSSNVLTWTYQPRHVMDSMRRSSLRAAVVMLEERASRDGREREAPPLLDSLPGRIYRATFSDISHGNFNVLEGMIPGLTGVSAVQPWSKGGPEARVGYESIARVTRAFLDVLLKGAPGPPAERIGAEHRDAGVAPNVVSITQHGPGRLAPPVDPATARSERVTVTSDGWRLVGDLVVPVSTRGTAARSPAVLMLNKATGDRRVYGDLARELARRGIASLRLDLRAHGESTNLGTFVPGRGAAHLDGSARDVAAALRFLRGHPEVDSTRIGVGGASYSGEEMAVAARTGAPARAYVALSPGSLSEQSINAIDATGTPWWIIVSANERFLRGVVSALRSRSRTAEVTEVDGVAHASDILVTHPEMAARIAEWFGRKL